MITTHTVSNNSNTSRICVRDLKPGDIFQYFRSNDDLLVEDKIYLMLDPNTTGSKQCFSISDKRGVWFVGGTHVSVFSKAVYSDPIVSIKNI